MSYDEETAEQLSGFSRYLYDLGLLEMIEPYHERVKEYLDWRVRHSKKIPFSRLSPVEARKEVDGFPTSCTTGKIETQGISVKLKSITTYFDYLVSRCDILKNPLTPFPPPGTDPLTCRDLLAMFQTCDITIDKGRRDAALLVLAAVAGLTPDEIISFAIKQAVRDIRNEVRLRLPETENRHRRDVWLWGAPAYIVAEQIRARLEQFPRTKWLGPEPLLVSCSPASPTAKLTLYAIDNIVKRLARSAGILRRSINADLLRFTHCDLRSTRVTLNGR